MCRSIANGGKRCVTSREKETARKRKYRSLKSIQLQIKNFEEEHGEKWVGEHKLDAMSSPKVSKALLISYEAHRGVERKSGEAYINHPLRVAKRLQDAGFNSNVVTVAILHDAVEDSELTLDDLKGQGFSSTIIDAVDSVTKRSGEGYQGAIERASQNPIGRLVKLSDNLDNSSSEQMKPLDEKRKKRAIFKYTPAKRILRSIIMEKPQEELTTHGSFSTRLLLED